jgi:GDPmannose 4,6-dehydratase
MWLMLQQEVPGDFVIGTGMMHSVRDFVKTAFSYAGLDWEQHVIIDPSYFRPTEVEALQADCRKASADLGWRHEVGFEHLVRIMVDAELRHVSGDPRARNKKEADSALSS